MNLNPDDKFPLKPHTSLHSITGLFIWGYKEACPHRGVTTRFSSQCFLSYGLVSDPQ